MRLQPTSCAEAPPVSWFKARKSPLQSGGDQVVALSFRKLQKSPIHLNTNGVNTHVLFAGIAAAVSKKSGQRDQYCKVKVARLRHLGWQWVLGLALGSLLLLLIDRSMIVARHERGLDFSQIRCVCCISNAVDSKLSER